MSRLIRDGILVATLILIICLALAGGWMVLSNAHILLYKHGGMCISYQCTPSFASNMVFLLFTVLSLAISAGTVYYGSTLIGKIFKS